MKAIIFDFDGVLQDTFEFHRKKIKEFSGIDLSPEEFKNIHKKNFFLNVSDKFKLINWLDYRDYVSSDVSMLKIKDKIRNGVHKLAINYKLFIVTSGGEKGVIGYLGNNGIINNFSEVLGMETHRAKTKKFKYIFEKYKLMKNKCIFVTDTLGDILEANEVGLKTIAVDFGFHCRETLEEGKPCKIVSSFNELSEIIDKCD